MDEYDTRNIAETLADVLPKAQLLLTIDNGNQVPGVSINHYAVPKGATVMEMKTDLEAYLANPRRTRATAAFGDAMSFLDYVKRHAADNTVAWCKFDPQTFALSFLAVIDEHAKGLAGWRSHRASFTPDMSAEWKAWKGMNAKAMPQVTFAEWLEEHADDITANAKIAEGLPTSLQMLTMATNFQVNEERVLKSAVRLNSGGVRMTYIADPDTGTTAEMQMFERFAIGIPVFHGGEPFGIIARLKYRLNSGKVSFFYELTRPDRSHQDAAMDLIKFVREGLGGVPLLMGGIEG